MITIDTVRQFVLSLPGTEEYDHFGKPAFRANKRTFSTFWLPEQRVMVKLSLIDQSVFCAFDAAVVYPVPNKWGLHGYTLFELSNVPQEMLEDALTTAWQAAVEKRIKNKKS